MTPRTLGLASLIGVAVGVAYTLSPLTVWFLLAFALMARVLVRDLEPAERRVVGAILIVAVLLRLAIVAGLFLSVDHGTAPFGSLFGDEEYFKRRSMWLRSMALDVNISEADRRYAFEEYSETSYLYLLAFVQVLVGDAPYGVHLFGMLAYVGGAVWLFRFSRRTFGPLPAVLSFAGVLFLPTLFFWSVSALRESLHFLLTVAAIVGTCNALTRDRWRDRIVNLAVAAGAVYALKDLRDGSMAVVTVALLIGSAAVLASARWRRLVIAAGLGACAALIVLSQSAVQERIIATLRTTALSHQGHLWSSGVNYKLLDDRFYRERTLEVMQDMTWEEAGRYIVRALAAAVVVPLPWQAETRLLKAYLPEQILWLGMVLLLPVGIWAAARRDRAASFVMAAYVAVMFAGIALRSGNVGTLVRHRGLVLPFVICLSAVAVCHLLTRRDAERLDERILADGAD